MVWSGLGCDRKRKAVGKRRQREMEGLKGPRVMIQILAFH